MQVPAFTPVTSLMRKEIKTKQNKNVEELSTNKLHRFKKGEGSFFSVILFRRLNVCKVLSMLEDAATFDQATIFTLNMEAQ